LNEQFRHFNDYQNDTASRWRNSVLEGICQQVVITIFTVLLRNSFAGSNTRQLSRYIQCPGWDSNPPTSLLHGADILQKLTGSQLDKFPAFYGTRRFISAFTIARQMSLPSARWFKPAASSNQGSRVTALVSLILIMDMFSLWPTQIAQREPNIFIFSNNINVKLSVISSYRKSRKCNHLEITWPDMRRRDWNCQKKRVNQNSAPFSTLTGSDSNRFLTDSLSGRDVFKENLTFTVKVKTNLPSQNQRYYYC